MLAEEIHTQENNSIASSKIKDYAQFIKLRLASLVVFSAAVCFALASDTIDWSKLFWLVIGGFLVTGSSNGFNQIIEKDLDALMARTANRPLPKQQMSVTEAYLIATLMGIAGIFILWFFMNPLSGILGAAALLLYTAVYTPLKRKTPFAVFVGAFPGAIPPMLGCVAVTDGFGSFTTLAWIVFGIQFMWQFPHFWAIAWVMDDDYKKAGFKMLPSEGGRDKASAFQTLIYAIFLIPFSLLPVAFGFTGSVSAIIVTVAGIWFARKAYKLYSSCAIKDASALMFASFIYLPIVQLVLLIDKI